MTIDFVRPAKVRGWCRAKALLRVDNYGGAAFWLETTAPWTAEDARQINEAATEIVKRVSANDN